jgi:hypothetical protein
VDNAATIGAAFTSNGAQVMTYALMVLPAAIIILTFKYKIQIGKAVWNILAR